MNPRNPLLTSGGVRVYSARNFQMGLILPATAALIGTVAVFFLRETQGRNIWAPRPGG